jgi:hypothetical protein
LQNQYFRKVCSRELKDIVRESIKESEEVKEHLSYSEKNGKKGREKEVTQTSDFKGTLSS